MQETRTLQPASGRQRGVAMAFVFVLVALLLLIAILVVTGAFNAGSQAQAVGIKYGVLNSAEAAANLALNRLAENPSEPVGCVTGTLNGASYRSCLGLNNLTGSSYGSVTDYANGQTILVPKGTAYIYGEATNGGNRKVYVEAIAQPAPPLTMPTGAINAAQNINDLTPMPINQDPLYTNDANMYANNNITVAGSPSVVQGKTFAVGTNTLDGSDGTAHSGWSPVAFPSSTQVAQAVSNAKALAQTGSTLSGATVSGAGTATYSGNVYVNGDVNITSGVVTFTSGTNVYIDGNLCISGTGALVNHDAAQGMLVVKGVVSSTGSGGYQVPLPANTMLLALSTDPGAINPCGSSSGDALFLAPVGGAEPVGTVFAPNGSVNIGGTGSVQGALDAGTNVDIGGAAGAAMQYDANQSLTKLPTGTMTYTAYNQD
jgi:hypothetical protein